MFTSTAINNGVGLVGTGTVTTRLDITAPLISGPAASPAALWRPDPENPVPLTASPADNLDPAPVDALWAGKGASTRRGEDRRNKLHNQGGNLPETRGRGKLERAYYRADQAIDKITELLKAA